MSKKTQENQKIGKIQKIFGTDGVRGKAGVDITPFSVITLGCSAGIFFKSNAKSNSILVGKDTRKSGYMIENALVSSLTSVGYNVIQIGPMPTPAIAFLTQDMRCDAGIMISASHNPFEDNGIKFFNNKGYKLDVSDEAEIEKIYFNQSIIPQHLKSGEQIGSSKRIDDVIGRYIVHIKNSFPKDLSLQGFRIVVDCANGAAYKVAPTIFNELGAEVIVINDEPNGYNINSQCGAMHPQELKEQVVKYRADVGFALDGDADRLVVVDNEGNVVDGDSLIGALAVFYKEQNMLKNNGVVATLMSNLALEEYLNDHKISLHRCNIGDKYVWEGMMEHGLNFGGEQSGHIIFSDYANTGDGLVSSLQVLALLKRSLKPSCVALRPFKPYPSKLVNLVVKSKIPLDKIEGYKELQKDIKSQNLRDLVRYSGTENKLRILLEGKDYDKIESMMDTLVEFFTARLG